jgi:Asp-tRNA(Asn)/Glu-tRNA(Gln) amidotransferase A subunit family amidase
MRSLRRSFELLEAIGVVFDQVDLLLTPTTATTAFVAEGPPPLEIGGQKVGGMGSVPYTAPFNISGMPGVSIPVGCASDGLPVGLQAVGRRDDEEVVLACGAVAEANRPWPKFAPLAYA